MGQAAVALTLMVLLVVLDRVGRRVKRREARALLARGRGIFALVSAGVRNDTRFNELFPANSLMYILAEQIAPTGSASKPDPVVFGVLWDSPHGYQWAMYFWVIKRVNEVYVFVKEADSVWNTFESVRGVTFEYSSTFSIRGPDRTGAPPGKILQFPRFE